MEENFARINSLWATSSSHIFFWFLFFRVSKCEIELKIREKCGLNVYERAMYLRRSRKSGKKIFQFSKILINWFQLIQTQTSWRTLITELKLCWILLAPLSNLLTSFTSHPTHRLHNVINLKALSAIIEWIIKVTKVFSSKNS